MIHIAVDESGSFGAVVDGEQYFIIGAFKVKDIKPLRKLFRQNCRVSLLAAIESPVNSGGR